MLLLAAVAFDFCVDLLTVLLNSVAMFLRIGVTQSFIAVFSFVVSTFHSTYHK